MQIEDFIRIKNIPIVYALKGRIKSLIDFRKKEIESKKGEGEITNLHSNINMNDEDKSSQMKINDKQTLGHKKNEDEKIN